MSEKAKKKNAKKKSGAGLIVKLGLTAFAGYMVFSLVSLQMEISTQKAELAQIEQQIENCRAENLETERLLTLGEDHSYRARVARDKLDMGYADEVVFRDAAAS